MGDNVGSKRQNSDENLEESVPRKRQRKGYFEEFLSNVPDDSGSSFSVNAGALQENGRIANSAFRQEENVKPPAS
eukprot:CAMPEP_0184353226 /NCGR_PEP_ID=MMETSP1089-20130417/76311_1 /TAXON_ID=38269 ORGANISM="Gloeochaete wittrockiana, Strain SAG46.84" /NCGR_SAMPLE_ID=MMETSP1089 /ASSEMBLY_ACC=CAM_ASM_000445 /LENGTH=74 /DNA_ID=CAMNT_0026688455 /DNA_START=109 /DNA_END=329 /DNA_ORIENTATION=-